MKKLFFNMTVSLCCFHGIAFCSDWIDGSIGTWNNPANWSAGVPNAIDAIASFSTLFIPGGATVTLDVPVTVGTINFINGTVIIRHPTNVLNMQGSNPTIFSSSISEVVIDTLTTLNNSLTINTSATVNNGISFSKAISGTGSLTKNGIGFLRLDAPCTYTGATNINEGQLITFTVNTLPTNTALTLASGATWTNATSQDLGSLSGGGIIQSTDNPITLRVGFDNTSTEFSGTISDDFSTTSLVKVGSGTFTLSGNNSYVGPTTVNGGTLAITSDANLGAGTSALTLNSGTTLQANGVSSLASHTITLGGAATIDTNGNPFAISSVISGSGPLTKTGTNTLTLSGTNTYSGATTVNGGTLAITSDANIGAGTSALTLNSGTTLQANGASSLSSHTITLGGAAAIDTNGNPFAISSVISGSGPLTKTGTNTLTLSGTNTYSGATTVTAGTLAITSDANLGAGTSPLTLENGTTLQANGASSLSAHTITLGGAATIDTNGNPFAISSVISGSGPLTKTGTNTLTLSGTNTYSGTTTVTAGTLAITSDANLGAGTSALTLEDGTTLQANGASSLSSHTITLDGDTTIDTNGNPFDISSVISGSGHLTKIGANTLTLSGSNNYSGGTTVSAGTLQGTTTGLQGDILNNATVDFAQNTTGTYDGNLSGSGNVIVEGGGIVTFLGMNSYTGGTNIIASELIGNTNSLVGTINVGAGSTIEFDQGFDGTYAGSLTGTGDFIKSNTGILTLSGANSIGNSTVTAGSLLVNGTLNGGGSLIVNANATLGGIGTITKDATISGTLAPGNSIGTIFLVGNQTLTSGSTLEIEFSPTMTDLVDVTGTFTVQPGATLSLLPEVGTYIDGTEYVIVNTTAGRFGQFSNITISSPLISPSITYTADQIILTVELEPFTTLFGRGNAFQVARSLENANPPPGSDLAFIIDQLLTIDSVSALQDALLQLQPSAFTSLTVAQENNGLYVKNAISNRLDTQLHTCSRTCHPGTHIWLAPIISFTEQKNSYVTAAVDNEPGYSATTPGFFAGIDQTMSNCWYFGGGLGYTFSELDWKQNRGTANIHSAYAALYSRAENRRSYIQAALIGAYSSYSIDRNIDFAEVQRTAFSNHQGWEGIIDARAALIFNRGPMVISPFIDLDVFFLQEEGFREKGADSLNLVLAEKTSSFLSSEIGFDISRCFYTGLGETTPFIQISVIRESRFSGQTRSALFVGSDILVNGLYPSRTLGALTAGVTSLVDQYEFLSVFYRGRYGNKFHDHSVCFEVSF